MIDLPANVHFEPNPDGWVLDDSGDVITSVQSFLDGRTLIIELWGTTSVVSPAGKQYDAYEFQQNSWIELTDLRWKARRIVFSMADDTYAVDDGVTFSREGSGELDIIHARHI